MFVGRLSEVGSKMSCVSLVCFGNCRMLLVGKIWQIALIWSGSILFLVSCVAIHLVRRCTMSSIGLGRSGLITLHLSLPIFQQQGQSPASISICTLDLTTSCVVRTMDSTGWGLAERPKACEWRNSSLELFAALWRLRDSLQAVVAVLVQDL